MAFSYKIVLNDPDHLGGALDTPLVSDLGAALADWSHYISGTGPLVVALNITSDPVARADGGSTVYGYQSTTGGENVYLPSSITELTTGTHLAASDVTINVDPSYLQNDLWANPAPGNGAAVPSNRLDATSVMLHEIGHGLGFLGFTDATGVLGQNETAFDQYIQKNPDGTAYFTGPDAEQVYGGPVPLTTLPNGEGYAHVGNSLSDPLGLDLMNGVAFYNGRTYDISNLDLAVLKDVGAPVTRFIGPSVLTAQAGDTLLQGLGADTLMGAGTGASAAPGTGSAVVAVGGSGTGTPITFDLTGDANVVFAGSGAATIVDNGQNSTVIGGSGADTIFGGTGGGVYVLGTGSTVAVGGTGSGTWIGTGGQTTFFDGPPGNLLFAGSGALTFVNAGGSSTVVGGATPSVLYGSDGGSVLFVPDAAGSLLVAGAGNETLTAAFSPAGVNMFAGSGNDSMAGGAGDDAFIASTGSATISGGGGADLFVFSQGSAGGSDEIKDFDQNAGDRLLLSGYGTDAAGMALSSAVVSPTGTQLTLSDNTHITLAGVTDLNGTAFA